MYKIMVIEDDDSLRSQVMDMLRHNGYEAYGINDYRNVLEEVEQFQPELIILDINLPYMDGNYFCHAIRKKYTMPIIITSARGSEADQILGMELGSDDYVVKPFSINVLMSKIAACLRRSHGSYRDNGINVSGAVLNEACMKLEYKDKSVDLSGNEYKLIRKFMDNPDKVLTREELLSEIWDDKNFVDDNTLTVNVTRVKKIFEKLGIENAITTKRGVGYIFMLEDGHSDT